MELPLLKRASFVRNCHSGAGLVATSTLLLLLAVTGCERQSESGRMDDTAISTKAPVDHYQGPDQPSYPDSAAEDAYLAATEAQAAADAAIEATSAGSPYAYSGRSYSTPCTDDCSGHDAGYDWADNNAITHPDECGGNSQSFIDGCEDYAREQQASQIEDQECEDWDGDGLCD